MHSWRDRRARIEEVEATFLLHKPFMSAHAIMLAKHLAAYFTSSEFRTAEDSLLGVYTNSWVF